MNWERKGPHPFEQVSSRIFDERRFPKIFDSLEEIYGMIQSRNLRKEEYR
jgi:hypothetical protein